MSNNNDDRLARLRARAEGAGFDWVPDTLLPNIVEICVSPHGVGAILQINTTIPENIDTAHALLTGLSMKRGPVVSVGPSCERCHLDPWKCKYRLRDGLKYNPGPDCFLHSKPGDDYEARIVWMRKEVE